MKQTHTKVALFTLTGVATEQGFMDPLRYELSQQLRYRGIDVETASLYPYGDWTRKLFPQLMAIVRDFTDIQERIWSSVGTRATRDCIMNAVEADHTVLLIGHSGGGITALQIAGQLIKAGYAEPLVVQIGSPKCPIPAYLKDNVLFLYATGKGGQCKDPIVRLGRWGGIVRTGGNLPKWKRNAYAPGTIADIPLIGSHPDYFRTNTPYIDNNGNSNLDYTLRPLLSWLERKLQVIDGSMLN